MEQFRNQQGRDILLSLVDAIQNSKSYLGEVDGLIGDGDHGANMNKGFSLFAQRIGENQVGFSQGLIQLGNVLFEEIGGSMGPIYGMLFVEMGTEGQGFEDINLYIFTKMVKKGFAGLQDTVEARPGDKTLMDTISPAVLSLEQSAAQGLSFEIALYKMVEAAERGRDKTRDMIAKFGRSSRLGIRSRGVLDAGAVSCCIILTAMARGISGLLKEL